MVGYLESVNVMHTRGITIDEKDYVFTLMVVLGETPQTAYAMTYDTSEFKKNVGTEDEESYLLSKRNESESLLAQQSITQLRDFLEESYRAHVQSEALNLKDFRFTGQETVQILNNLLKTRVDDLESSSVRDVVSLLKALSEQGALEMGDGGFSRHFIQISPKFNALCVCGHEIDVYPGIDCICPHCRQVFRWSEEEKRFYPNVEHL